MNWLKGGYDHQTAIARGEGETGFARNPDWQGREEISAGDPIESPADQPEKGRLSKVKSITAEP